MDSETVSLFPQGKNDQRGTSTCEWDTPSFPLGRNTQQDKLGILLLHLLHQSHCHMYLMDRLILVDHQGSRNPMNIILMEVSEKYLSLYKHIQHCILYT